MIFFPKIDGPLFYPRLDGWRLYYHNIRIRWALFKRIFRLKRRLTEQETQDVISHALQETLIMFGLIGALTVVWAEIELNLDGLNGITISHRNMTEKKLPLSLRPKIGFFKKSFDQIPELASLREQAATIVNKLNRLKKVRHDIIHGAAMPRTQFGRLRIIRTGYHGKELRFEYTAYTFLEILAAANEMAALKSELHALFRTVLRILHPDAAKQAFGEL